MSSSQTEHPSRSPRRVVALMMALVGAMFVVVLVDQDVHNLATVNRADLPWGLILRYVVAMGVGGAVVGWLLAGTFGRSGIAGWVLAAVGGVLSTVIAGMLGSAVGLMPDLLRDGWQMADLIPIAAGLLVVPLAMAGHPLVAAAWVVMVALTHVLAARAR